MILSHKNPTERQKRPKQTLKHLKQEKRERESVEGESDVEQVSPSNKHWSSTSFSEQGETEESIENRPVNREKEVAKPHVT